MSKLTADLVRKFNAAKEWFSQHDGYVERSDLQDGERVSLMLPGGVGSMFLLQNEEPGDYEEGFVQAVEDMKLKLGHS